MQDVDYKTDYSHLNYHLLQSNELLALSHIHAVNYQKSDELSWLPFADPNHIRLREASQAENYRQLVNSRGLNLSKDIFTRHFNVASRYMGLRYMSWFLQVWKKEERWLNELNKYLKMAIS